MPSNIPVVAPRHERAIKQGVSFTLEDAALYHAVWRLVEKRRKNGERGANFSRVLIGLARRGLTGAN